MTNNTTLDVDQLLRDNADIPHKLASYLRNEYARLTYDDIHAVALTALWESIPLWDQRQSFFRKFAFMKCSFAVKDFARRERRRGLWHMPRNIRLKRHALGKLDQLLQERPEPASAEQWDRWLALLSDVQAQVVRLVLLDGQSWTEAAVTLSTTKRWIGYHYRRAVKELAYHLKYEDLT